jgi:hypothetical protein
MRLSIWLMPVFTVGLALSLQRARSALLHTSVRPVFDGAAIVVSIALVATAMRGPPKYPFSGARSAAVYIESLLGPNDAVLVRGVYQYAAVSRLDVAVEPTPEDKIAFRPSFRDRRIHYVAFNRISKKVLLKGAGKRLSRVDVVSAVAEARRVFLYRPGRVVSGAGDRALAAILQSAGYRLGRERRFGTSRVLVWERTAGG